MQIVSVTVSAKHQITQINELELTFNWKWNSKQKKNIYSQTCLNNHLFKATTCP